MKLIPLFISMLVFLMSGVMCLFSTSEVFAQVPQTKRSEQDSFLKNIRAKKRNNDLQKARRGKVRSNQKNQSIYSYSKPKNIGFDKDNSNQEEEFNFKPKDKPRISSLESSKDAQAELNVPAFLRNQLGINDKDI